MKRLAIIAGKGHLPLDVAAAAVANGYVVLVLSIKGQADADFNSYETIPIWLGAIGKTRSLITDYGIDLLVMVGKVVWPSMTALHPDFDGIKLLGTMITKGDDNVLRVIAAYFAEKGIVTIAPNHFLPDRKMPTGIVAGKVTDSRAKALIAYGLSALDALGGHDVGQSIVVQNGRIIAIEAAEGSDAMIARSTSLLDPDGGIACLLKMAKSKQDLRLDMPVFGCDTILVAAAAGISVLAIEAESVLLADDLELIQASCVAYGLTLIGIEHQESS